MSRPVYTTMDKDDTLILSYLLLLDRHLSCGAPTVIQILGLYCLNNKMHQSTIIALAKSQDQHQAELL